MFRSRSKAIAKIEKTLLKAKNRNPVFFDEDSDSFIITDMSSNTISKIEEKDEHLIKEEGRIVIDAYDAMSLIGKNEYFELIPSLYEFLEDPDEYLREKSISTLEEFHAEQLPGLEGKLLKIWSDEKEEYVVRTTALGTWAGFYRNTYNRHTLKKMYQLLKTKKIKIYFRLSAFLIILDIVGEGLNCFEDLGLYNKVSKLETIDGYNEDEFNATLDLEKINSIMEKYAPEALQNE